MGFLRKKRAEKQAEVPMAAMIDVVFLLLIYFILTQEYEPSEAHLAVNLPAPDTSEQTEVKPRLLELEVHPGQVMLQGVPRPLEQIRATLERLAGLDPEQTVMVKTSEMARTQELVQVLDMCRGVGLTKLNVVTLQ